MALDIYDLIVALVGLASLLYLYGRWDSLYFSRRGVKSLPISHIPFVGNMLKGIQRKSHFRDAIIRTYKAFPEERYVGFKQFLIPIVMLTDLELIKQVAIKDFDHFSDHIGTLNEDVDQLFGKSLFSLKGQKWRDMRATLSPAFTSSKIRGMFEFVTKCGKQMADFYVKMAKEQKSGSNLIEIEMKDAFTRYTNDVIATTAFGIEVNSLEQPENEFYMMGKSATNFRGIQMLKMFGFITMPRIMKLLNITLFSEETKRFFRSLVSGTMAEREKNHVFRPDMIQLLMEAKKGSLKHEKTLPADVKDDGFATVEEFHLEKNTVKRDWTDDDITAQALLFFVAGFDTSSTLLCFAAHELTINPDVQKRLQQEIDLVAEANGGIVSYQALQNMKFLDCVISETLRLWPPAVATDRICTKPYSLPPPNEYSQREFKLEPGKGIWIPINAIHHDPKYFKDPEKFDPERFSDENKGDIIPFTFIPFGIGPRNCIGSRFALMEAKAVLFYLLHQFDFVQIEKTQNPIRLRMDSANLDSEKGFWIGLKPRTQE